MGEGSLRSGNAAFHCCAASWPLLDWKAGKQAGSAPQPRHAPRGPCAPSPASLAPPLPSAAGAPPPLWPAVLQWTPCARGCGRAAQSAAGQPAGLKGAANGINHGGNPCMHGLVNNCFQPSTGTPQPCNTSQEETLLPAPCPQYPSCGLSRMGSGRTQ